MNHEKVEHACTCSSHQQKQSISTERYFVQIRLVSFHSQTPTESTTRLFSGYFWFIGCQKWFFFFLTGEWQLKWGRCSSLCIKIGAPVSCSQHIFMTYNLLRQTRGHTGGKPDQWSQAALYVNELGSAGFHYFSSRPKELLKIESWYFPSDSGKPLIMDNVFGTLELIPLPCSVCPR